MSIANRRKRNGARDPPRAGRRRSGTASLCTASLCTASLGGGTEEGFSPGPAWGLDPLLSTVRFRISFIVSNLRGCT